MRKLIYLVLIILFGFFLFSDFMSLEIPVLKNYSNGLVTEMAGVLITFTVIDGLLTINRQKKRKKYKLIAMRLMVNPVWDLGILTAQMIKASLSTLPNTLTNDLPSTLNSYFAGEIEYLDFKAIAPVIPKSIWSNRSIGVINSSIKKIREVIDTYLEYLDVKLIDKILLFENGQLVNLAKNSSVMISETSRDYDKFPMYNRNRDRVVQDLVLLAEIISEIKDFDTTELLNGLTPKFWNPSYGAVLGSARVPNLQGSRVFPGIYIGIPPELS